MLVCTLALPSCFGGSRRSEKPTVEGIASWYGKEFGGRPTASGEIFKPRKVSAAHRTYPFGTIVRVKNLRNGKTLDVRINDRGPFAGKERIIDLSRGAAKKLDMIEAGIVPVRLTVLKWGEG